MINSEFDLINQFIAPPAFKRADVSVGIGDDCAVLDIPAGMQLAVSMDTLVEGRHFAVGAAPEDLGHKTLAVNLSDLAAMGASPAWVTLSLTMPSSDIDWLCRFMAGFSLLAKQHEVQLIGGDTTKGPLSITVQAHGFVDPQHYLRRNSAKPGDLIYVTGTLGDAGLALLAQQGLFVEQQYLASIRKRLDRPTPRVEQGKQLARIASAAIDLSDGLASDLQHVVLASNCGATIHVDNLPCSEAVRTYVKETGDWSLPASSGDDYELCFTVPDNRQAEFEALLPDFGCQANWIGTIERQSGIRWFDAHGDVIDPGCGYDHFRQ
jgi:thiamine-monophosphate kinase